MASHSVYSEQKEFCKVPVGNASSIIVKTYKRDGVAMISIRKFIDSPGYVGFSKEGVDFTPEQAAKIYEGLNSAIAESSV